jgi:dTDP-4-amino-4,6-dideoxygalactose transaminase
MLKRIKISQPIIDSKEIKSIISVAKSGWLTNGPKTIEFEKSVNKIIGSKNAIAVNSCTNGIIATMHALGLKRGDEIITTPLTFVSVIHSLYNFGLKIKLVDINYKNLSIDLKTVRNNVTRKTKCVLITHYGGIPVEVQSIISFCKKKKIHVIEDAATAFGAKVNNKHIGSYNNSVAIFSFYANKVITTGEGGVITLNNSKLAKKIRNLISCGINKDPWRRNKSKKIWFYKVSNYGFKFNFTDLQASIGIEQIKKLKKIQSYRNKLRLLYNRELKELTNKDIISIKEPEKNKFYAEYIYTIILNEKKIKFNRDDLINYLKKNNIDTTVHYIPANKHDFYKKNFKKFKLINSDYVFKNIISLPFHNRLKYQDIIYISKKIKNFINNEKKNEQKK